jgi:hypothetical protein
MAGFVKRRVQEKKKQARRELSRTLSLALAHGITSRVTIYKPTGPMYFLFCRLYPSSPQQPTIESIDMQRVYCNMNQILLIFSVLF